MNAKRLLDVTVAALGRRFELDELPQLWNVLEGEMSLVGPRPNVERDEALYTDDEPLRPHPPPGATEIESSR